MDTLKELFNRLPPIKKIPEARKTIREWNAKAQNKIVVLDDDPTGSQTVHNIRILINWNQALLEDTLTSEDAFYILTNSRAFDERRAIQINRELVTGLIGTLKEEKQRLRLISRSDSTLRGHFRVELDTLIDHSGPYDGILIVPYFLEGGRYTLDDRHYVALGDQLVEAKDTEFAKDPVFGFRHSYLPEWVEEKSKGKWKSKQVMSVSLHDIRIGGVRKVKEKLMRTAENVPVIINSVCDEDLEIVVLALIQAETDGKRFLYRTAASFVKIRFGLEDSVYYNPERKGRGLIIVGSHVSKTTKQLSYLLSSTKLRHIELKIEDILGQRADTLLTETIGSVDESLTANRSMVLSTERTYKLKGDSQERLAAGEKISDFLSNIVSGMEEEPDFIISKGGITSCDVAKLGLKMNEALIVGPIIPGIPVWKAGRESKFPNMTYVVFPGNVGGDDALWEVFRRLSH